MLKHEGCPPGVSPYAVVSVAMAVLLARQVCRCQQACAMSFPTPSATLVVSPKSRCPASASPFREEALGVRPLSDRSLTLRELVFSGRSALILK